MRLYASLLGLPFRTSFYLNLFNPSFSRLSYHLGTGEPDAERIFWFEVKAGTTAVCPCGQYFCLTKVRCYVVSIM
jgi:hypothetical protein